MVGDGTTTLRTKGRHVSRIAKVNSSEGNSQGSTITNSAFLIMHSAFLIMNYEFYILNYEL